MAHSFEWLSNFMRHCLKNLVLPGMRYLYYSKKRGAQITTSCPGRKTGFEDKLVKENLDLVFGWHAKVSGPGAYLMLKGETGLIEWETRKNEPVRYFLKASLNNFQIQQDWFTREHYYNKRPRRTVKPESIKDQKLDLIREFGKEGLLPHFVKALEKAFSARLLKAWSG